MTLHFHDDLDQIPQPRNQQRILAANAQLYIDGRRFLLKLSLTPFAPPDRPNLAIATKNQKGLIVASTTVIAIHEPTLSLTLHLSTTEPGNYLTTITLYFDVDSPLHTKTLSFILPNDIPKPNE